MKKSNSLSFFPLLFSVVQLLRCMEYRVATTSGECKFNAHELCLEATVEILRTRFMHFYTSLCTSLLCTSFAVSLFDSFSLSFTLNLSLSFPSHSGLGIWSGYN